MKNCVKILSLFALGSLLFSCNGNSSATPSSSSKPVASSGSLSELSPSMEEIPVALLPSLRIFQYSGNQHYYCFIEEKLSWLEAEAYCERIGGHLATFTTAEEDKAVVSMLNELDIPDVQPSCWLGAQCATTEDGSFAWVTGEPFDYTRWNKGEPNHGEGGAEKYLGLHLSNGVYGWNDYKNDFEYSFFCEWDDSLSFNRTKPLYFYTGVRTQAELLSAIRRGQRFGAIALLDDIYLDESFPTFDEFSGRLHGANHTLHFPLKELDFENKVNFIDVNTGILEDIVFDLNVKSTDMFERLGGVVLTNKGTLRNVRTTGTVDASKVSVLGALVGYNEEGGSIVDCRNEATVKGKSTVGGLIGYWANPSTIQSLVNAGNVSGSGDMVGGVIGKAEYYWNYGSYYSGYDSDTRTITITKCSNEGNVTGENDVGGVVGEMRVYRLGYRTDLGILAASRNKNKGNVSGINRVGGVFGKAFGNHYASNITLCECSGTITGTSYMGGIVGHAERVSLSNCTNEGTKYIAVSAALDGDGNKISYIGGYAGFCHSVSGLENGSDLMASGRFLGGVVGWTTGSVKDCSNTGFVSSSSEETGGIAGRADGTTEVRDCQNSGRVSGLTYVGGIIGRHRYYHSYGSYYSGYDSDIVTVNVASCVNSGLISGTTFVGGISGWLDVYRYCYRTNNGLLHAENLTNRGNVEGEEKFGAFFGHASTDRSGSYITGCENLVPDLPRNGELNANIIDRDIQ